MNKAYTMDCLSPGKKARVTALSGEKSIRRRLRDIGICEGVAVECVGRSPLGDPSAYCIKGAVIALRREDSRNITVED